ncbi:energy transducer TonB [uncultured Chryseobacterium sp.]|uniref:energy transducer TonB n=1 Tax=uncultured Chryseobacterium sp. TaxID=259322 RepID=UPI0026116E9E|nr:energy transducer TonB [uncultured Chryseobacterium sp.]
MKKIVFFIFFIAFTSVFSQQATPLKQDSIIGVYQKVDVEPSYPGGINAFRTNFMNAFNAAKITAIGTVKCEASFIIDEEGNVSKIVATGNNPSMNNETVRSIREISKKKWEPAKINGKPVKYKFRLPLTMSFE